MHGVDNDMGGIFGMVGGRNVAEHIVTGLSRLEYRGGDGAGVAIVEDGALACRHVVGAVENLAASLATSPLPGQLGLGHTRRAHRGAAIARNVHPLLSSRAAVVHDGVVENYAELRRTLERDGCRFYTDTDSEVIAWLLDTQLERGHPPFEALRRTTEQLHGTYAIGCLLAGYRHLMMLACQGKPLVAAWHEGISYAASDTKALSGFVPCAAPLHDGQILIMTDHGARLYQGERLLLGPVNLVDVP